MGLLREFPEAGLRDWSEAFLKAPDPEHRGPGYKVQLLADLLMGGPHFILEEFITVCAQALERFKAMEQAEFEDESEADESEDGFGF